MSMISSKKPVNSVHVFREQGRYIDHGDRQTALVYLRDFVSLIRPPESDFSAANLHLEKALKLLYEDEGVAANIRRSLFIHIHDANLVPMLTESGMAMSRSFGKELNNRIKHKFIPPLKDERDFQQLIDGVFYKPDDFRWVESIPHRSWAKLLAKLGLSFRGTEKLLAEQVYIALQILSTSVAQLGWEKEVHAFLPQGFQQEANPFMQQQTQIHKLHRKFQEGEEGAIRAKSAEAQTCLEDCLLQIRYIRENTQEKGASLSQSFILYQMEQKINRMLLLIDFIDADHRINGRRLSDFFMRVVRNENRKYSIREFLRQTTGYLAYQIAEQKGRKGSNYITSTPAEYRNMILSAMQGGFIICFVAVAKNLLTWLSLAPFWQGFAYSLNYSAGFILIEETQSTLATKQPAFTANAVAGTLDERNGNGEPKLHQLAVTIAKVSRSQFASFLGNLLVVFPGTFVLAWIFHRMAGYPLASGEEAIKLMRDQHPWQSLSLLYACNTGVFLFISGLIAGYVQNKMKFGRLGERIIRHPFLRFTSSPAKLHRLADYWNHHAGSIVGSIALGFFLGMAGTIGKVFGIPFDIRHITIAAGNASIGLYGADWSLLTPGFIAVVFFGVMGIGLMNFLVSFSLAFFVALRSRGLSMRDYPEFFSILWRYMKKSPLDFIRPRRRNSG